MPVMNYSTGSTYKPTTVSYKPSTNVQTNIVNRKPSTISTSTSTYKPSTAVQVNRPSTSSQTSRPNSLGQTFNSPSNLKPSDQPMVLNSAGYGESWSPMQSSTTYSGYTSNTGAGGNTGSGYQMPSLAELYNQSQIAVEEAKKNQEASKASALGYYDQFGKMLPQYQQQLGQNYNQSMSYYQPLANQLAGMQGDIINPEQLQRLKNERTDALASSSQNLMGAFGDSDSGINTGRRLGIAMGTANEASNIPLQAELDVGQANRAGNMDLINQRAGLAGSMANLGQQNTGNLAQLLSYYQSIASGKSGIQQNYQYDPGLDYITKLSAALGKNEGLGAGVSGGGGTISGASSPRLNSSGGTSGGGIVSGASSPGLGQLITNQDYGYNPVGSSNQSNTSTYTYDYSTPLNYDTRNWI